MNAFSGIDYLTLSGLRESSTFLIITGLHPVLVLLPFRLFEKFITISLSGFYPIYKQKKQDYPSNSKTFCGVNGICLNRFPVKDAKALETIAPINGRPASPIPVGLSVEGMISISMLSGASSILRIDNHENCSVGLPHSQK